MRSKIAGILLPALASLVPVNGARAQSGDGLLVTPATPDGFPADRDVNLRAIPGPWAPLGKQVGALIVNAEAGLGNGITSNTYQVTTDPQASSFVSFSPKATVRTNWSRHAIRLSGDAQLYRYIGESRRNESTWRLSAGEQIDVSSKLSLQAEGSMLQGSRNRFSGDIETSLAPISTYRQDAVAFNATYTAGRSKVSVDAQLFDIRFKPFKLANGASQSDAAQDRTAQRLAMQFQYALTPTVAFYVQGDFSSIDFDRTVLHTIIDSDSDGGRLLAGTQISIAGYATATVAVGYSMREYAEPGIKSVKGFSAEAQIEVYLSPLTTISVEGGRRFSDTRIVGTDPYFQTQVTGRIDHALLRNLLLSATAQYSQQDYIVLPRSASTKRFGLSGRYLGSRRFELGASATYNTRSRGASSFQQSIDELRGQIRLSFKL